VCSSDDLNAHARKHCPVGQKHTDEHVRRQDVRAAALAAMLGRHLAHLRKGPEVQPHGTLQLSSGFRHRLEHHTLRGVVCIQVTGVGIRRFKVTVAVGNLPE
jgi:hypothetical protein